MLKSRQVDSGGRYGEMIPENCLITVALLQNRDRRTPSPISRELVYFSLYLI